MSSILSHEGAAAAHRWATGQDRVEGASGADGIAWALHAMALPADLPETGGQARPAC